MPNGLVAKYRVRGARAFEGQEIRAAVHRAFASAGITVAKTAAGAAVAGAVGPGVVEAIVKALMAR